MNHHFRKAASTDIPQIWEILKGAIERRKKDGSQQWQDGYPNENSIREDIEKGNGYVLTDEKIILGYTAILINDEPAYDHLEGHWLSNGDFVVVHRLAISGSHLSQGLAQKIMLFTEGIAKLHAISSIKVDTNFDNIGMLRVFEKLGYTYCGEVMLRGGIRKAYEKIIN
jgi:GNAT superfamily N-acetyltransferase